MTSPFVRKIICSASILLSDLLAWWIVAVSLHAMQPGMVVIAGVWGFISAFWLKSYTRRVSFWAELKLEIKGMALLTLISSMVVLLVGHLSDIRGVFILNGSILAAVMVMRHLTRWCLRRLGLFAREVVIFGVGVNAQQTAKALLSDASLGHVIVAYVDPQNQVKSNIQSTPVWSWPQSAQDYVRYQAYQCVVALEDDQREMGVALMRDLALFGVHDVHLVPSVRGVPLNGMDVSHFFSHDVTMIHLRYQLVRPLRRTIKRIFDVVVSTLLLILLSPLFVVLMYKVSRDGGGPFYGHPRIGKNGRVFKCYKFRSMIINSKQVLQELFAKDPQAQLEWEKDFKLKNDPRITPVGHFLRRTSLDELPQLWNVLKGDMSLVGPRPIVQEELARYEQDVGFYLLDKPGMTGLWQVSGRNDVDYKTRVYFDAWYVKNWSLWTDVVILFKTVNVVLKRDGAY